MIGAGIVEGIEESQLAIIIRWNEKLLSNEIDYSRQQFNYNIENIKAIPENIEKVSGIYHTNNFVPYLQDVWTYLQRKSLFWKIYKTVWL